MLFVATNCDLAAQTDLNLPEPSPTYLQLTSREFPDNGTIPIESTCHGPDLSPPLSWNNLPAGTKSLALIVEDPDAPSGNFVHWIIFNIPPSMLGLPSNLPKIASFDFGAKQGINDFRKIGYNGPCPPSGVHRYFFRLYALDTLLKLDRGVKKKTLLKAMESHILCKAELMGKFAAQPIDANY